MRALLAAAAAVLAEGKSCSVKLNHCVQGDKDVLDRYDTDEPDRCCAHCENRGSCKAWEVNYNKDDNNCILYSQWSGEMAKSDRCDAGSAAPPAPPTPPPYAPPTPAPGAEPHITGVCCAPEKMERGTAWRGAAALLAVDLDALPSPLNTNASAAARENFCCLYCVRDSRCRSWTLRNNKNCALYAANPGARAPASGAVSGSPYPRVPDIPYDPKGKPGCVSSYAGRGPYKVRRHMARGTGQGGHSGKPPLEEVDTCTPCSAPEPAEARYLIVAPDTTGSNKWPRMPAYVWLPAEGQAPGKYGAAMEHIASHGFVVVSPVVNYLKCHSNICKNGGKGKIYRDTRDQPYSTKQRFKCGTDAQGAKMCIPSELGFYEARACETHCGPLQPLPPPNTTCSVEQEIRGKDAAVFALEVLSDAAAARFEGLPEHLHGLVDPKIPIAIGGASATAPVALKVASHLSIMDDGVQRDDAKRVGAVVLQHPSWQPSHNASMTHSMDVWADRAANNKHVPAVLAVSGKLCAELGPCAAVMYDKPCRSVNATPETLAGCTDCSANAGPDHAWGDYIHRYSKAVKGQAAAASIAGPWHHWTSQSAGEVPIRRGCGGTGLLPETPFVIAWLSYALKGDKAALRGLKACAGTSLSSDVDGWLLPRIEEDRLRMTPAGQLIDGAVNKSGTPLQLRACGIAGGRVAAMLETNFTGA